MLIFTWQLAGAGDFSDVIDEGLASKALILGLILFVMNLWEFFIYANDGFHIKSRPLSFDPRS